MKPWKWICKLKIFAFIPLSPIILFENMHKIIKKTNIYNIRSVYTNNTIFTCILFKLLNSVKKDYWVFYDCILSEICVKLLINRFLNMHIFINEVYSFLS